MTKVVFCVPTIRKPFQPLLDSLEAALPLFDAAGYDHYMVSEVGCPYISAARATMLRKALTAEADVIVFLDHDVSFRPEDLLRLVETEGDYIVGTYRYKNADVEYMGALIAADDGRPIVRSDGALLAHSAPAGFMKITRAMVNRFMKAYPELTYGPDQFALSVDLFNHGAHKGVWYGEDYACSRNWRDAGGQIWLVPDLNIDHHSSNGEVYPGNFHEFLMSQPGGQNAANDA